MDILKKIKTEIESIADKEQALHLQGFFKTGKGQYGEGDVFLGIKVPQTRAIAKKYYDSVSLDDIQQLLKSKYHEERLLALIILVFQYEKTKVAENKKEIFEFYLKNTQYMNNWDLVDLSCPKIVGSYVYENKNFDAIYALANSKHLWSERISVVSQLYLIKKGEFSLIVELSEKFLPHNHDLMHKAVGWMLREMGKVDEKPLCDFLNKHSANMPRTMLRYSIERLPEDKRLYYLNKDSNNRRNAKVK